MDNSVRKENNKDEKIVLKKFLIKNRAEVVEERTMTKCRAKSIEQAGFLKVLTASNFENATTPGSVVYSCTLHRFF